MAGILGDITVDTSTTKIVYLQEQEGWIPYIVIQQGKPESGNYDDSCDGTWLIRQNDPTAFRWDTESGTLYPDSDVNNWLNITFLHFLTSDFRNALKTVRIPYCSNRSPETIASGPQGLECQVFLLSASEIGANSGYGQPSTEGALLQYFIAGDTSSAKNRRSSIKNKYWTRSVSTNSGWAILQNAGDPDDLNVNTAYPVMPVIILPSYLPVDDNDHVLFSAPAPSNINVPSSVIATQSIAISWSTSSGADSYKLERQVNGGSWKTVYTGANTSYTDTAQTGWSSVVYRVSAGISGVYGDTTQSSTVTITTPATPSSITVPGAAMTGQTYEVLWDAVTNVDSYKLERRVNSGSWTTVYTGPGLSFTNTAQTGWTSVQYRVSAGIDGVYGDPVTSSEIDIIAASALVISGADGSLGTITAPVTYSVTSDTGNQITVEETVGNHTRTLTPTSGQLISIPVSMMDPAADGSGQIVIKASVTASSGQVNQTRSWTYTKTPLTLPTKAYRVEQLQGEAKDVMPLTLAEAVMLPDGQSVADKLGVSAVFVAKTTAKTITLPFAPSAAVVGYVPRSSEYYDNEPQSWLIFQGQTIRLHVSGTSFKLNGNTVSCDSANAVSGIQVVAFY